jgi:hypothetical protein
MSCGSHVCGRCGRRLWARQLRLFVAVTVAVTVTVVTVVVATVVVATVVVATVVVIRAVAASNSRRFGRLWGTRRLLAWRRL